MNFREVDGAKGVEPAGCRLSGSVSLFPVATLMREFGAVCLVAAAVFLIRIVVVNLYLVPTGSMLPTIKIDDRLIVNKLSYGLWLPFFDSRVFSWSHPQRGDVVVFENTSANKTFIKRVVGVSGDRLFFQNGTLVINGNPVEERSVEDSLPLQDMGESGDGQRLFLESLSPGRRHYILRGLGSDSATVSEDRVFEVPAGKVFLLGDNRDGSSDSRDWGLIDENKVYGRAILVLYSTIRSESWIPSFRAHRFFEPLDLRMTP